MKTQCERILAYLRRVKRATNVDLMMLGTGQVQVLCPWKRIEEIERIYSAIHPGVPYGYVSYSEKIVRHYIKSRGGKRIVQYHLVRI